MGVSFWGPYSKDPTLLLFRVLYESPLFPKLPYIARCIIGWINVYYREGLSEMIWFKSSSSCNFSAAAIALHLWI